MISNDNRTLVSSYHTVAFTKGGGKEPGPGPPSNVELSEIIVEHSQGHMGMPHCVLPSSHEMAANVSSDRLRKFRERCVNLSKFYVSVPKPELVYVAVVGLPKAVILPIGIKPFTSNLSSYCLQDSIAPWSKVEDSGIIKHV